MNDKEANKKIDDSITKCRNKIENFVNGSIENGLTKFEAVIFAELLRMSGEHFITQLKENGDEKFVINSQNLIRKITKTVKADQKPESR